jgi:hypothetical protein
MKILNLTQHAATADQIAAGVFDAAPEVRAQICALLTSDECPKPWDIADRAKALVAIADQHRPLDGVMIGGAPWLMGALESALRYAGMHPRYFFSRRESVEQTQAGGSVKKINVFRHVVWVDV